MEDRGVGGDENPGKVHIKRGLEQEKRECRKEIETKTKDIC
jgi:hypothetical protein